MSAAESTNGRPEISWTATYPADKKLKIPTLSGEDADDFSWSSISATTVGATTTLTGYVVMRTFDIAGIDHEYPRDANHDNVYKVVFHVTDEDDRTVSQALTFTITDVGDTGRVTREATGFADPVAYASIPSNDIILGTFGVVAERAGLIRRIDHGSTVQPTPFLDLTGEVSTQNGMGVIGVLIHDDGAFYSGVYTHDLYVLLNNLDGDLELRRYQIENDRSRAIKASQQLVLRVDYPDGSAGNRGGFLMQDANGGRVIVGLGDGGTPDAAQNPSSHLGKVLRIQANGDDFPADPNRNFRIPFENPPNAGGLREIWAMGLRSPAAGNFNPRNGDVYVTDLGEALEEVNLLPFSNSLSLLNFGWPRREGTGAYNGGADDPSFIRPIAQRTHSSTSRMTGGLAQYGRTENLQGEYFFGDALAGGLYTFTPRLIASGQTVTSFANRTTQLVPNAGSINAPVAIVQDANLDMFILDSDGEIFKYHATWY